MRLRLIVGGALVATAAALTVPAVATPLPAACVVVHGPNGVTLQVGSAPHGPSDCRTLP